MEELHYPSALIAVEVQLPALPNEPIKRADAIVYNNLLQPQMLIEFKASSVPLTQTVLDQIAVYNRRIHAPFLVLHNGVQTVAADLSATTISFLSSLPEWQRLANPQ